MATIRVLLADDHAILREGVRILLESQPGIQVVGDASNGLEVLDKLPSLCPDVVVMDITMPHMNGLEATRRIKDLYPDIQILVLTMHESQDFFFQLLSAGASGYVLKEDTYMELVGALRTIVQGGVYVSPLIVKKLAGDYLQRVKVGDEERSYAQLTKREREVLRLLAEGKTNREIADQLCMGVNTVQTHRLHIMEKLNLHNKADLIKYAIRKGLISVYD
ncbi:MAG: response regulator [Dehalococcoidia bacterium]